MSIDKASVIDVCELCSYHLPESSTYLAVTTQILRATETKVLHLQHHFKEEHSKGILFLSNILILLQTVAETGRTVPLFESVTYLPDMRQARSSLPTTGGGISLHRLTGARGAGISPQLPLKQVPLKMKEVSIQGMPSHSWHIAHIQEGHQYCRVDIKFTLIGTYATCLAKAQHAPWEHPHSSPQLHSLHTWQPRSKGHHSELSLEQGGTLTAQAPRYSVPKIIRNPSV